MKKKSSSHSLRGLTNKFHPKTFRRTTHPLSLKHSRTRSSPAHQEPSVPAPLLPLIGRKQEIAAICSLLQEEKIRLLTLTGPGGVGKTRLAMQISTEIASAFPDGICFVSLVPLSAQDDLLSTIAQAYGLTRHRNISSLLLLQEELHARRSLLILDNFEHISHLATQLKELLMACPQLKVLVTSRIVLGLLEEQTFYVHPLALPDLAHLLPCEDLSQVAAVSLFLQRVHNVRPDFKLTNTNAMAVAQICVCLDGLPLALELAAARMKLFSPQGLLTRLDHRLSLLTGGPRDAPERQQTLRKTIEWSYDLLTREEQRLFRWLAVFVDGCSLQAIEALSDAIGGDQEETVLDILTSLLNQSLLQRVPQAHNHQEQRFMMLETIREYALECLRTSEEEEAARRMHAAYYLACARNLEAKITGAESPRWLIWIESEFENFHAAFNWLLQKQDAEQLLVMSGSLWAFWLQSSILEGIHWIHQALTCAQKCDLEVGQDTLATTLHTAAMLEYYRSNWAQAEKTALEALELFRQRRNNLGMARVLVTRSMGALLQGQYASAGTLAQESLALHQKTGCPWNMAEALLVQAYSSYFQGNGAQAYLTGKKALKLGRQTGELYMIIRTTHACALFADALKDTGEVQAIYEEVLARARTLFAAEMHPSLAVCLIGLGAIAAIQKHYIWAVSLWGKAKTLYRRRDGLSEMDPYRWLVVILETHLLSSHMVQRIYTQLGDQTFRAIWQEGQSMALEQVLERSKTILKVPSPGKSPASHTNQLTVREKEVLGLLAQGLSSASIAEKLVISLVTVNTHIRAIYGKLGVSSRSAATRFAIENHLV